MSEAQTVSWREVFTGPNVGLFAVLCFGVWLHAADSTLVATLLPSVVAEVGGEAYISWSFVLYRLASIAAACCGAIVAMRFGLRRAMIWAALAVGLGCAISAVTPNMLGMLVGRTVQGTGGGLLLALTIIGIARLFPAHYTPRVMAVIAAVWGASSFLGPLAGGIFAEFGHWRLGFWAFVAQSVLLAGGLLWALPAGEKIEADDTRIPWRRLSVLSAAILAISTAGLERDNTVMITLLCIGGLVGLTIFLRLDRNAGNSRMLPRAVADLRLGAGIGFIGVFLLAMTSIPFTVYGPVLMDVLHDIGPLAAGYLIALESISWTAGALLLSGVTGAKQAWVIRGSFLAMAVSAIGLAVFFTSGPIWAIIPFLLLAGGGFGACYGHVVQRCVDMVTEDDKDRAAGAMPTVQSIGYALGAAICGFAANLVGYGDNPTLMAAQAAGLWIFIVMVPVAISAALLILRFPQKG